MLTTPRTSPAKKSETNVKRSVMFVSCGTEVAVEPGQHRGPRASCCFEIGSGLRVLCSEETVSRARVYLSLVRLAHGAHRRVGGSDRSIDALVVLAVQPEQRR